MNKAMLDKNQDAHPVGHAPSVKGDIILSHIPTTSTDQPSIMSTVVTEKNRDRRNNHHNIPDNCPRCLSQGYRGTLLATRWPGEASCLQCGFRFYGNNGNGHHSSALLKQTAPYLIKTEHRAEKGISQEICPAEGKPSPDHELPSWINDSPIFNAFVQVIDDCAAAKGGCERCGVKRKCRALYNQASLIAVQGHFNLCRYRIFERKVQNLTRTP
jgi:hypothetical protein